MDRARDAEICEDSEGRVETCIELPTQGEILKGEGELVG